MGRKDYEIIDHTADIGIIAYGVSIEEAFVNAARALFNLIIEPEEISEKLYRDLQVTADDAETLLVYWLNELIYLFDAEYFLFRRFEIELLSGNELKARCYGEKIDLSRHKLKRGVKAATYHMLKVDKNNNSYRAQVLFDI